ncbi:hypothetical protein ACFE04_014712 [Oxalis oulophora]
MYSQQSALPRTRSVTQSDTVSSLESSLLQIYNDHRLSAIKLREISVETVNGGVQECFINEKRIEFEIRSLATSITRFMKLSDQWLAASHAINTAVKEIGDFENWMKTMEFDCKTITTAITNIHQE